MVDAATYVVAIDGDDEGPGTPEQPWRTIQHAVNTAGPGETVVVRAGEYHEQVTITVSGTPDAPIRLVGQPGERPVIDGRGVTTESGVVGLVTLRDASWVEIGGFEIRNWVSERPGRQPVGILVTGSGDGVGIVNNEVHHIEARNMSGSRDAHGIAVYGDVATEPISQVRIIDNEVHDLVLGSSEAVVVNGNVDGFEIIGNTVRDVDNIGIDIIGYEGTSPDRATDRARNGVVANNRVHHVDTALNDAYGHREAAGIYVDGGSDVVIEANTVHDSNMGIEIASEAIGGAASNIVVRHNVLYRNHIAGLAMGGYGAERGRTEGCIVEFNTLVDNDTDATGNGELWLQHHLVDNRITDNIVVAGSQGVPMTNPYLTNDGSIIDRNLWFTTGSPLWEWTTTTFTSFEQYRSATGNDRSSLFHDPAFVDSAGANFQLTDQSPARHAGNDGRDLGALSSP